MLSSWVSSDGKVGSLGALTSLCDDRDQPEGCELYNSITQWLELRPPLGMTVAAVGIGEALLAKGHLVPSDKCHMGLGYL